MTEDLTGIGKAISSVSQPIQAFLSTILGPASAEVGELLADNIRFIRWKNTLRILEKAQREMEDRGLQPKEIPLKTLVPILEGASLEGDSENLQAKWSNLLTSAASGNISHPSYPKILSELIHSEAKILDYLYTSELTISSRRIELNKVDEQYRRNDLSLWQQKRQEVLNSFDVPRDIFRLSKIKEVLSFEKDEFSQSMDNLLRLRLSEHPEEISEIDVITSASLSKYERRKPEPSAEKNDDEYELDIDEESITNRIIDESSIRLTKLGMNFMRACQPISQ
ncbi:Abi-alpha family protein [Leptolyngbya sp. AN02str]|uniref:Abi-alpha family protein n=1 Tax=Leptolyngbya sp. AN02str TaxID=3423363 RepID=UPI003D323682